MLKPFTLDFFSLTNRFKLVVNTKNEPNSKVTKLRYIASLVYENTNVSLSVLCMKILFSNVLSQ